MGNRRVFTAALAWVRRQPRKVQILVALSCTVVAMVALKLLLLRPDYFFVASVSIHCVGILLLIYKLTRHNSCSGISLKTQELTGIYLVARLGCTFWLEHDAYTFLYFVTLASTSWVIYMMRSKLKSTYLKELDTTPLLYVILPCVILGILIHPYYSGQGRVVYIIWASSLYLESVSVFPQLRMMQNTKMVEPFTAHYVFALGVSRFFSFANWTVHVIQSPSHYWYLVGAGHIWIIAFILAEIVQTFILADFCYYYVKSVMNGKLIMSIRSPV